uniref:Zinc transporter 1-like n=1 Tax=Saccoglossus kowalevskii TaxID=10224 RepID=A0ABM0LZT8_SACKO
IARRRTNKNTFGWVRAEVLGALVNAVFLVALCFSIVVESLKRLLDVETIENPKLILVVGSAGLLLNLIGLALFHQHGHSHGGMSRGHSHGKSSRDKHSHGHGKHGHSHGGHTHIHEEDSLDDHKKELSDTALKSITIVDEIQDDISDVIMDNPKLASSAQLNMRGVFLHVLGDALGSVIVVISALVIWFVEGDWKYYVDPAMSLAMVMIILCTTIPLLKESAMILLQTVPTHIKVEDMQSKLVSKVSGVLAVHEFHVWRLAGNKIIASAHIRCKNLTDYMRIASQVKEFFHDEGIHSTTIQPEFVEYTEIDGQTDCMLECSPDKCAEQTCCGNRKQSVPLLETNGVRQRISAGTSMHQEYSSPHSLNTSPCMSDAVCQASPDCIMMMMTSKDGEDTHL